MNKAVVLLLLMSFLIISCTPQTPTSCEFDSDCSAVFNRCSCSWVCLNKNTDIDELFFNPQTEQYDNCQENTCLGDINPDNELPKPTCGCLPSSEQGNIPQNSQVTNECKVV